MTAEVLVYRGKNNQIKLKFSSYDDVRRKLTPLNFTTVTRMVLVFPGMTPVIAFDTLVTPGVIQWDNAGNVTFNIQQYALPVGNYAGQLIAYDPDHPEGQVVTDGMTKEKEILFDIREVMSSGLMPPPLPTGGDSVLRDAGETISALKALYEAEGLVYALDVNDTDHAASYLGISITSGSAGTEIIIQRTGTLDDGSWSWTTGGEVFVGAAGALTQVAPTVGFKLVVGTATSATRIELTMDTPIFL